MRQAATRALNAREAMRGEQRDGDQAKSCAQVFAVVEGHIFWAQ
jgi:hypothetical protein